MKYSLRSLMIVVTVVCVVLGGRIEYLRRMAVFHEQEALRHAPATPDPATAMTASGISDKVVPDFELLGVPHEHLDQFFYHERLARYYRTAMYRPWQFGAPSANDQP